MLNCIEITKEYHLGRGRKLVLDRVNLQVQPGQKVGVLGRNGAGKSTLIKIIGGVELPTAGRVERTMSVSWPLGFSGAFQGSLSGIDNLKFIARIYGMAYWNLRAYVDDFAELGRQLADPVKTYSSGMRARLAFAISIAIDFDCYLIDEVIMVGDHRFVQRCQDALFSKGNDRALIVVSHEMNFIRETCQVGAVIHQAHLEMFDNVEEAVQVYLSL